MNLLIAYDIADSKRLRKIAKLFLNYGDRLQYSIFEFHINQIQYQKIQNEIETIVNWEEDRITYIPLCEICNSNIKTQGKKITKEYFEDENSLIIS